MPEMPTETHKEGFKKDQKVNKHHLGVVEGGLGEKDPLLDGQVERFGQLPEQVMSLLPLADVEAHLGPQGQVGVAAMPSLVKLNDSRVHCQSSGRAYQHS